MRRIISTIMAATLLAAAPAAARSSSHEDGEAKLARILEGRVAGPPTSCVTLRPTHSSRIVSKTAIVYEGPGNVLYVNRPRSGAASLSNFDVMVSRRFSDRLCKIDTVRLFDPTSRMQTGLVFLGDFVPYRKVRQRD